MAAAAASRTTVAIGRAFEERSLSVLHSRLSMSLAHVGSVGDGGIDLQGWWWLPRLPSDTTTPDLGKESRRRIRVLAQCKTSKQRLGPVHLRELEGAALLHMYSGSARLPNLKSTREPEPAPVPEEEQARTSDLVAMLISSAGFTTGTTRRAMASPVPFLLLHLPVPESEFDDDQIDSSQPLPLTRVSEPVGSIIWNSKLAGTSGILGGHMEVRWELGRGGRPVLYWRGKELKHWVPEMEPEVVRSRFDLARPALSS